MPASAITVYWRPGCGFCAALFRSLERAGLDPVRRNIWEDEEAAAVVREITGGNETVPTVTVGDRSMVNPSGDAVLRALAAVAPDQLPDGHEPPPGPTA